MSQGETSLKALDRSREDKKERSSWTLEETKNHGWPSWRQLQRIETGKNVTVLTILKLADLYEMSVSEIFKGL